MTASILDNKCTSQSSKLIYSDRWCGGVGWQQYGGEGLLRSLHNGPADIRNPKSAIYKRKTVAKHDKRNDSAATVHCCDRAAVARRGLHNAARHACTDLHICIRQRMETGSCVRGNFSSNYRQRQGCHGTCRDSS